MHHLSLKRRCKLIKTVAGLLVAIPWVGCKTLPVHRPVTPPPEHIQRSEQEEFLQRLLGSWELPGKDGKIKQIIFETNGQVIFRGGMEYFNPGTWELNANAHELKIAFPQTPNEKLDIFHMYLGNGIKAFDRPRKEITYQFDAGTWELNVAGWTYSKPDKVSAPPEAEPVIK